MPIPVSPTFTPVPTPLPQKGQVKSVFTPAFNNFISWTPSFQQNLEDAVAWMEQVGGLVEGWSSDSEGNATAAAQSATDAEGSATTATEQADIAVAAVAALPEGTINDAVIATDKAWSSQKISDELSAGSQLGSFQLPVSIGDLFTVPFSRTETSAAVIAVYREEASLNNSNNTFLVQSGQSGFTYDDTKLNIVNNKIELKQELGVYPTEEYIPAVTTNPLDTSYWTDIAGITPSDTLLSGSVNYALSSDGKDTWYIFKAGESPRPIVRNNVGTWEYNSNLTFEAETWTAASVNTMSSALSEAMNVETNRMNNVFGASGYGLSTAAYDSVSFSVAGQDTAPYSLAFNNDGSKMYVVGTTSDSVHQYTLSTPFNLSTASYDSVSFSVAGQEANPTGLAFNNDGSKMYVIGITSDSAYQYTLSTPFDLSTASYDSVSFSVASQDQIPYDLAFNNDGSKMYVIGALSDSVHQYTLSTPFNLSTASYDSVSFSVAGQDINPYSLAFNNDGSKMYVVGTTSDSVHQYTLSTPFNLSTAAYDSVSFSVAGQDTAPYGLAFNSDGSKMYVVGATSDSVYQYTTVSPPSSYLPLTDTLDQAVILYTDSSSKTPTYENTAISYDSFAEYKLLTPKVDYEVAISDNTATVESKVSGNIKGRIL